jgi:hypothetical protein
VQSVALTFPFRGVHDQIHALVCEKWQLVWARSCSAPFGLKVKRINWFRVGRKHDLTSGREARARQRRPIHE